jgi:ribosomal protein S21
MIIVKIKKKGGIEKALKEYKSKVIRTKQLKDLRDNRYFEKKSQVKRKKNAKAKYVQNKYRDNG